MASWIWGHLQSQHIWTKNRESICFLYVGQWRNISPINKVYFLYRIRNRLGDFTPIFWFSKTVKKFSSFYFCGLFQYSISFHFYSFHLMTGQRITFVELLSSSYYFKLYTKANVWIFKLFGGHKSFLWDYWYLWFWLLVMSFLGLKARVDPSFTHFVVYVAT